MAISGATKYAKNRKGASGYNGLAVLASYLLELDGVSERVNTNQGKVEGDVKEGIFGEVGAELLDVVLSDNDSAATEYYRFITTIQNIGQSLSGGSELTIEVVSDSNAGYIHVVFYDEYNDVYINEKFFEDEYALAVLGARI